MKDSQQEAAQRFAARWAGKGYEKGQSQPFWIQLLREVYGVEAPEQHISFEVRVSGGGRRVQFIDAYIEDTKVLIEQKGLDIDLGREEQQSDGPMLTPYGQAKRYADALTYSKKPRYIVCCNFREFWVYDMEKPGSEPEMVLLKDLGKEYNRLQFLVDPRSAHLHRQLEVSVKAGELVGKLYDAFHKEYLQPDSPESLHSLNVLCVRLVFCLYAEDTDLFGRRDIFHDYLDQFPVLGMSDALERLFEVLDTPYEERDPYLRKKGLLGEFPYVNGGLFADRRVEIPPFTLDIRKLLLEDASLGFDWSEMSPTIFGAVFESTLNPETRRSGGMHYTSVENIHKVIDPLFMNQLNREFSLLKGISVERVRERSLRDFQQRLSELTFLDPACGSGNFLTESYISLRLLENAVLQELWGGQGEMAWEEQNPVKVSLSQFHGIEINDFAVTVAKTALWIAESQMLRKTESILRKDFDYLPLKSNTAILEGNALRLPWQQVIPPERLSYIIGNPPFSGARLMGKEQKQDVFDVFRGWKNTGNLDYVCCWYKRAAEYIKGTDVRCALVSTNSIAQGEQVDLLWKPLMEEGIHIDFAHRSFKWDNEASHKAHVHCVIVGFSAAPSTDKRLIYTDGVPSEAGNINGYLIDAPTVFIESRSKPLCPVPEIGIGNQPIDDGNYLFSRDEMEDFILREPASRAYFKPFYGAYEFINRKPRYCLWLGDCTPAELRGMPLCMKRVQAVREFRLASRRSSTLKLADKPTHFQTENMPKGNFIIVAKVSTSNRSYVPMGFMTPDVLCSDLVFIIPNASLYHFGVLTSSVHNAWLRAVCGRLGMGYRYSKDIVYNNFPWPQPTGEQKGRIEQTAREILRARDLYPQSSLADLYDELTMPAELRQAHQRNDRAVQAAYGWAPGSEPSTSEQACVSRLMQLYQALA
ncbi:MAG: methylase [Prevotellaceae bacterium]|nr:methylase [Prevotellaceae bacterium]